MSVDIEALAAAELLRRRRARKSLLAFAESIEIPGAPISENEDEDRFVPIPGDSLTAHHRLMLTKIESCMNTPYGRLMLFLPPGMAKSTYASVVAPAWEMGRRPGTRIILGSYGLELAKLHGAKARQLVRSPLYRSLFGSGLARDTSAKEKWAIEFKNGSPKSEYMASGLSTGITGHRANGVILDDPIKGREAALSPPIRAKIWNAMTFDLRTRVLPKAWMILIETRWHDDDPAGRLLPKNYNGETGRFLCNDGMWWDVLCIPAEAERDDDPLGRKPGEMLWPEYYDADHWTQFKSDELLWSALYQQRPKPDGAGMFQRDKFKRYKLGEHPKWLHRFITSDFATKPDEGDFTEHGAWGVDQNGELWILDWFRMQCRTDVGAEALLDLAHRNKCRLAIGEKGVIWNSIEPMVEHQVKTRRKANPRYRAPLFKNLPSVHSKPIRALTFQGLVNQGKVHVPFGPDYEILLDQLQAFPSDRVKDDGVDCCTLAGRAIMEAGWANEIPPAEPEDEGLVYGSWRWLTYEDPKPQSERFV